MAATIGVDIGSIAAKAIVYDPDSGQTLALAREKYTERKSSEIAKLDADDVKRTAFRAIQQAAGTTDADIHAIGFSTIMHSVVMVDENGDAIQFPSEDGSDEVSVIIYADNRAADLVTQFQNNDPSAARDMYEKTGCVIHPSYAIWKLRWLNENHPQILQNAHKIVSLSEYVLGHLIDNWVASRSVASTLGYLDIHELDWDDDILHRAGVSRDQLPELYEMTHSEPMTAKAAAKLGLTDGMPVTVGSGDGLCAQPGTGSVKPGMLTSTIGTTGAVRLLYKQPVTAELPIWCYYLLDSFVAGNAITSGGNCLEWVRENSGVDFTADGFDDRLAQRMKQQLDRVPVVAPFLYGERGPGWHSNASAMLYDPDTGKTIDAEPAIFEKFDALDLYIGFMEGVTFNLYHCLENLTDVTRQPEEIRVTGGITDSDLWMQMKADIYNQKLRVPRIDEPVAVAASLIAQPNIDTLDDFSQFNIPIGKEYEPNPQMHEKYMQRYALYRDLYENAVQ